MPDLLNLLLTAATERDLFKMAEAAFPSSAPSSAVGALQALMRADPAPDFATLVAAAGPEALKLAAARAGLPLRDDPASALLEAHHAAEDGDAERLRVEVPRKRPRLAWQGMHRTPAVVGVPAQVLEVVRPGLSTRQAGRQLEPGALSGKTVRGGGAPATNRLIWTNDNLIALASLLEERDEAGAYRYRGKVDLVYIDPPFMVNSNFVADNAISVDVDEEEGVAATKEPRLVELLAYKDTWREGLDSFLSMIRARLVLLKELLAPTGSIYVHLDWHAAHYVKVLMDEVFGYDNFVNEIVWHYFAFKRKTAKCFPRKHDVILSYGLSDNRPWEPQYKPHRPEYIAKFKQDSRGKYYRDDVNPTAGGSRIIWLDDVPGDLVDSVWNDTPPVNSQGHDNLGYPTQKPIALVERIIAASCPPGGLVLDCFGGSGTTAEAAEKMGRQWISIDISKYAVHLSRKRLIVLHGTERPAVGKVDFHKCEKCDTIKRKDRKGKSLGRFEVAPFSVESLGVYQRAEAWLSRLGVSAASAWRPEMVRVYGGEPIEGDPLVHGRKGDNELLHVGPLDAPVPAAQVWSIARAAQALGGRRLTVLTADLDRLDAPERATIEQMTGVRVTMKVIPQAALDAVAARLSRAARADGARESMAIPAFYSPLSVSARATVQGRTVTLSLDRCEVDVEAFIASQRPALKSPEAAKTAAAKTKAETEQAKWETRRADLEIWLAGATSWRSFVDFWAVDWDYGDHQGPDGRPVFDTEWQSFRQRKAKGKGLEPVLTEAEGTYAAPGRYQIAVKVTDVFGNDGLTVLNVEVR